MLDVVTIDNNLIYTLEEQSMKGMNTYNLVLFMIDKFEGESKQNCIEYIKSWLTTIELHI